ncbi:MAG: cysteine desulfurase family protein [Geminicoccaceae bacterium]|nr:cysteine desulfurase family protein [Geminicoccaceae bacterium]
MSAPVYLDWAATAPVRPEAAAAVVEALREVGNPSSVHAFGRRARARLEAARRTVARSFGLAPDEVVFTSGGTEANQLAVHQARGPIAVGAIEHLSVLEAVPDAVRIPVAGSGVIDLAAAERLLAEHRPALVACQLANNETGAIQPVRELARLVRAVGARLHVDAVQAAGKLDCAPESLGADTVAVSAHKLGGPMGVGALLLRPGLALAPRQPGGGQESGRRAGTPNLPGIVGFAAALECLPGVDWAAVGALRDRLERSLRAIAPELAIVAGETARLPTISCVLLPGLSAEAQLVALDLEGIAVSAGSACSSGKLSPSHVLVAMGFSEREARCTIRVSLGWSTSAQDIDRFLRAWERLYRSWCARRAA